MGKPMTYNKNPISLKEGKMFIDGVEVMDSIQANVNFTPQVWQGRTLGERSESARWLGYSITGNITHRRSTNWLEKKIREYVSSGATPELTVTGVMNDENSDYYAEHGTNTVTLVGVVLTGDLPLTRLDSNGEVVEDNISFHAKEMV